MKSCSVLANDSIEFKGQHFSQFPGKIHYLGLWRSKLKTAHLVNYFPGFLGKNIKNCPPSKLFLFTSLVGAQLYLLLCCVLYVQFTIILVSDL